MNATGPALTNKLNLIYGFFNQYVFPEVKMNILHIKSYYKKDPITSNNDLISSLLNIIEKNEFVNITESTFRISLESSGKLPNEVDNIINSIKSYKFIPKINQLHLKSILRKCVMQ